MIELLNEIMWYALILLSILFLISGIDDLFFDAAYWVRFFYRPFKMRKYKPLAYKSLADLEEKKIAIIIPCWQESDVIGDMLNFNLENIDYANYNVFIGVYPNDKSTVDVVKAAEKKFHNVFCVINKVPGPTSKANNLNSIYQYISEREQKFNTKYDIYVLHDSEDIIHPLSFKLYNYLLPKKDMIQIPIFPLKISQRNWTYWTYCDEFAELHTKELPIREIFSGFVPSAGVGTALSSNAMTLLTEKGAPFSEKSIVEDYDMAYRLKILNADQIFVVQFVDRVKKVRNWFKFGKFEHRIMKDYVATYALFPKVYASAIRQKSRWALGIGLQEWKNMGWQGNFLTRILLFHDRKSIFTHFINGFGYVVILYWIFIYLYYLYVDPNITTLGYYLDEEPWVWTLIVIVTLFMLERLLQRAIATYRIYGLLPAIISVPRTIYSNIINLNAIVKAYRTFYTHAPYRKQIAWDKTQNRFPSPEELREYRRRLGDILLQEKSISSQELQKSLSQQQKTGEKLGHILRQHNYMSKAEIISAMAKEYHLPIVNVPAENILSRSELTGMSEEDYHWLIENNLWPIDLKNNVLMITLDNPGNQALKAEVGSRIRNFEIKFVLNQMSENI